MCDYSLGDLPNRLAVEGEELVAHRFRTGSMGLASPLDLCAGEPVKIIPQNASVWSHLKSLVEIIQMRPVPAVCIPPGARLAMRNIPSDLQREWKVGEEEDVRFVQTSVHAHTYRDAIEFESGRRVRLQELREGMRMDVLCLAASVSNDQGAVPRGDEAHAVKFR